MFRRAVLAAAAIVAGHALAIGAAPLRAQGLLLTGYADFEATADNVGGDGNTDFFFDNHHVNMIALADISGDLFAAAEVEYEHAGEELEFEYGYFGFTGVKNIRFMAGKFIVPFGRFNKDLHPTWINKMIDRPHGFRDVLPQTYSDVGVWVSAALPMGKNGVRATVDGYVINGLMGDDGGSIRSMRGNDREKRDGDRDDNKAVGARVGLEYAPQGFDVGGSFYTGNYSADPMIDLNLTLLGADAAYRNSGVEVRGEIVTVSQEISAGDDLTKTGGYGQIAYRITNKWEPVIRFSGRNMPGETDDLTRFSLGISYYLAASSSIRANYHLNSEKGGFEEDNNQIALQWNIVF